MPVRSEARVGADAVEFFESIGIAVRGAEEHGDGEAGGSGRRDAVFAGHEFEGDGDASGLERGVDLAHDLFASGDVEVVQKVGGEVKNTSPEMAFSRKGMVTYEFTLTVKGWEKGNYEVKVMNGNKLVQTFPFTI